MIPRNKKQTKLKNDDENQRFTIAAKSISLTDINATGICRPEKR